MKSVVLVVVVDLRLRSVHDMGQWRISVTIWILNTRHKTLKWSIETIQFLHVISDRIASLRLHRNGAVKTRKALQFSNLSSRLMHATHKSSRCCNWAYLLSSCCLCIAFWNVEHGSQPHKHQQKEENAQREHAWSWTHLVDHFAEIRHCQGRYRANINGATDSDWQSQCRISVTRTWAGSKLYFLSVSVKAKSYSNTESSCLSWYSVPKGKCTSASTQYTISKKVH